MRSIIFLFIVGFCAVSCSDEERAHPPAENYGDIYVQNGNSFFLSEKTHELGWGKKECFMCHNVNNIHLVDRTAAKKANIGFARLKVHEKKLAACAGCHGKNGLK